MAENITAEIQEEFAKRVLRPQISQLEIKWIAREILESYVTELNNSLRSIPGRYKIPRLEWERHLEDIAVLTANSEAARDVPLSLKSVAVSSAVATGIAVKALGPQSARPEKKSPQISPVKQPRDWQPRQELRLQPKPAGNLPDRSSLSV